MKIRLEGTEAECQNVVWSLRGDPTLTVDDESRSYPNRDGRSVRVYLEVTVHRGGARERAEQVWREAFGDTPGRAD